MGLTEQITAYKLQVNNGVSTQSDPDSISPDLVGAIGTDLADILLPALLTINYFGITAGTASPFGGANNDLYYKSNLNNIEIYRNINGTWFLQATIPLGISFPDGITTGSRTSLQEGIITVTAGAWAIDNTKYSKSTQTQLTIEAKDPSFGRWDLIYANTSNQVLLLTGEPTLTPVKPALPANSIAIDYVFVPSIGVPYLSAGQVVDSIGSLAMKTIIPFSSDTVVLNWQTDIIPGDTRTYVQKHGNNFASVLGTMDLGGGIWQPFTPNYTNTINLDGSIDTITFTEVFGTITII